MLRTEVIWQPGAVSRLAEVHEVPIRTGEHAFVVTDSTVGALYAGAVEEQLRLLGAQVHVLTVPASEESKGLRQYGELAGQMLTEGVELSSWIVALGGGVVSNLAGFLAATIRRGLRLVHLPTTLMGQIDVCIDFKQGINLEAAKNQLGTYYAATLVVIDPTTLDTLPERQYRSGFAEVVKHAVVQDRELFEMLVAPRDATSELAMRERTAMRTIGLKAAVLDDTAQRGRGELLPQYGHAVAHAIERVSNYEILHGEALGIGMCVMADVAAALDVAATGVVEAHERIVAGCGLPTRLPAEISVEDVLRQMTFDKHYEGGEWRVALVREVGELAVTDDGCEHRVSLPCMRESLVRRAAD